MAERISRINFCKKQLRVSDSFDLETPLDTVQPVGLGSMGCQPLVSHRRASNGAIVSRFERKTGAYNEILLTTLADQEIIVPSLASDLSYNACLAGLPGENPLTGSDTSPFPVTEPTNLLIWSIAGHPFNKSQNGSGVSLASDPNAFDRSTGNSTIGFGGNLTGQSGGTTLLLVDGLEYRGGTRLRANHSYRSLFSLPYIPSLQPLTMQFTSGTYKIIASSNRLIVKDDGSNHFTAYSWSVCPCLIDTNGEIIAPSGLEPDGPSLSRKYSQYELGDFTMPGYGGSEVATFDLLKTKCRGFMTCYADSSRVSNISVTGASLLSKTSITLPVITTAPSGSFQPPTGGWNFDTVYQFDINGNEANYIMTVTHGSTTLTSTATALFAGATHIRNFELWVDMHQSGNVNAPSP